MNDEVLLPDDRGTDQKRKVSPFPRSCRTIDLMATASVSPALDLFAEIARMKRQLNAVILAHYYQEPDIQDIADVIGDSLALAQAAALRRVAGPALGAHRQADDQVARGAELLHLHLAETHALDDAARAVDVGRLRVLHLDERAAARSATVSDATPIRVVRAVDVAAPEVQLLSTW